MNPTIEVLNKRRSIRAYAGEWPLSHAEKDAILHAAFRAPTAGNMMLYSILEVEDQALKDRLAETCDHQPFIAKAPYVLLFLADFQRWWDAFISAGVEQKCQELAKPFRTPGAGDLLLACCDALIAAQNAVIAAESLGIGSCYIGDILENYEIHRDLFNLPRYALPITLLTFGRPAQDQLASAPTPRFGKEFILHKNTYRRLDEGALGRMQQVLSQRYTPSPESGIENVIQSRYFRKFAADFALEMNRSAAEMLKNWTTDQADE